MSEWNPTDTLFVYELPYKETIAKMGNVSLYSSLSDKSTDEVWDYSENINNIIYGSEDQVSAFDSNEKMILLIFSE